MFVHSQHVPASVADVFAWHERPGAIHRLTPPWQPLRVEQEADSLRDGVAVLRFPAGRRWVARHDPTGYRPGERFVDRLDSRPFGVPLHWKHEHDFAAEGDGTRVIDRVETSLPGRLIRPMFGYRHRQLVDDLRAHAWAAAQSPRPLTVAVSGSSGTVGGSLVPFLTGGGHRVIRLVRRLPERPDERQWNPDAPADDLLAGVDAVVHLAGAGIAGRFTAQHKAAIRESRVGPTRRLADLAAASGVTTFVGASAIGFYGPDRGDEVLTEDSSAGDGFLAETDAAWESATRPAAEGGCRTVLVRTGIVQSARGGALPILRRLFSAGVGGPLGGGGLWMSWIGIDDLVGVYHRTLFDSGLAGPVNAVAPAPVTSRDYARALGRALHRPALVPTPGFGPRLVLGRQGADEVALASQRVSPAALHQRGHAFRHPEIEQALRHELGTAGSPTEA